MTTPDAPLAALNPRIFISAGEASGDAHAAHLLAAIRRLVPQARFSGIGGDDLAREGMDLLCHARDLAVVGLTEVLGRLPRVLATLAQVRRHLRRTPPQLVILVDFPDFNFLIARLAKARGIPVLYYISPQVWAWRQGRVRTLRRLVDRMVVIFPFEEEFYRRHRVPVTYVGHPLPETLPPLEPRPQVRRRLGVPPAALALALLPGSRGSEINHLLPVMLQAAARIAAAVPQARFLLPLAPTAPAARVRELVTQAPVPVEIIPGRAYEVLWAADLALVTSGTATLETALLGTPMVIAYRVTPLTYALGRRLIRVPHIGMANLLAGERLFPELIQADLTPDNLAAAALNFIRQPSRLRPFRKGLERLWDRLGPSGVADRAAAVAVALLSAAPLRHCKTIFARGGQGF